MKHTILYYSLLMVGLCSCMKDNIPDAKLNITLDKIEYYPGDTVVFKFHGNPDNMVFYSGENGHNYELRNRLYADNDLLLNFASFASWGAPYDNLQLLVSNDFDGIFEKENVSAATWVDITDQVTLSEGADQVPSGEVNLKSYASEDDAADLYIAFRYTDSGTSNRWVIRSINVNKVSPEGVVTNLAVMSTIGWTAVDFLNETAGWQISTAQILMNGSSGVPDEDWIISKAFNVRESVPDEGVALKNISTTMDEHQHVYTEPGTYIAVFETSSVWYSGSYNSITEVTVHILEPEESETEE